MTLGPGLVTVLPTRNCITCGSCGAEFEIQDARIARVQDAEPIHARLHVDEWPDFAIDQHDVTEVLADPDDVFDVARWVQECPVRVELTILDNERNLVCTAGDANWVGFPTRIELVADNVGPGEAREDIESRRAERVIVKPQ